MHFDPDRLQVLAGVQSHTNYRYKKLNEMEAKIVLMPEDEAEQGMVDQLTADLSSDEVEVETLPGLAAGVASSPEAEADLDAGPEALPDEVVADVAPEVEELPPEEDVMEEPLEEPLEEKLRRIIRTEVRQIVSEEISKRDEAQIEAARKNRSVATAMGFPSSTTRQSSSKRWSPTLGFAGPGFKK